MLALSCSTGFRSFHITLLQNFPILNHPDPSWMLKGLKAKLLKRPRILMTIDQISRRFGAISFFARAVAQTAAVEWQMREITAFKYPKALQRVTAHFSAQVQLRASITLWQVVERAIIMMSSMCNPMYYNDPSWSFNVKLRYPLHPFSSLTQSPAACWEVSPWTNCSLPYRLPAHALRARPLAPMWSGALGCTSANLPCEEGTLESYIEA